MLISTRKLTDEELREEISRALADRSLSETDGVPGTGENDE